MKDLQRIITLSQLLIEEIERQGYNLSTHQTDVRQKSLHIYSYDDGDMSINGGIESALDIRRVEGEIIDRSEKEEDTNE